MNELKEKAQSLKELIVAHDLAKNFDYVPNFKEEETDDFFQEFIQRYEKETVQGACKSEGSRSDEIANHLETLGLELVNMIEDLK